MLPLARLPLVALFGIAFACASTSPSGRAGEAPDALPPLAVPVAEPSTAATSGETEEPETAASKAATAQPVEPAPVELSSTTTRKGGYTVAWRPVSGPVPMNEHFEIEVWVHRNTPDPQPLAGARLFVSGWMPDHRHGMLRKPQTEDRGDGSYVVRGMLLHMRGHWQVFFDVVDETGVSERAEFDLHL